MKKIKKIVSSILIGIITLLIIFIGYYIVCNVNGKIAFLGGKALIKIVSPSMETTIPTGEYIYVEKIDSDGIAELEVGDIITFRSHDPLIFGKLNTHRICEVLETGGKKAFKTRGDNNHGPDDYLVYPEDIAAKYCGNSDTVTKLAEFFSRKPVFLCAIIIPSSALLIFCIFDVINKAKKVKMELLVEEEVKKMQQADREKDNNDSGEQDS